MTDLLTRLRGLAGIVCDADELRDKELPATAELVDALPAIIAALEQAEGLRKTLGRLLDGAKGARAALGEQQ